MRGLLPWEASGRVRRLIGWSGKQFDKRPKGGARCGQEVGGNSPSHWPFRGGCTDGEKQKPPWESKGPSLYHLPNREQRAFAIVSRKQPGVI